MPEVQEAGHMGRKFGGLLPEDKNMRREDRLYIKPECHQEMFHLLLCDHTGEAADAGPYILGFENRGGKLLIRRHCSFSTELAEELGLALDPSHAVVLP